MRLIIAEKHSVGQAIAQAVGGHAEKHDGYIQVGGDLVTWAQGHLVDLAAPLSRLTFHCQSGVGSMGSVSRLHFPQS